MTHFAFEISRMKKMLLPLILTTAVLQLLFLYFFALVGHFDHSDSSGMLTNYSAVLGLATTGTMCAIAIYGTVLSSEVLVRDYVGISKSKTYLLPTSRKGLFYTKIKAFSTIISSAMIIGLLVANLLFMGMNIIIPLTANQSVKQIIAVFVSIFVSISLTLAIILFSSFVGIKLNSTVKGVIASVVFVVLLSNFSAIILMSYEFLSLIAATTLIILVIAVCLGMGNSIDKNEAL